MKYEKKSEILHDALNFLDEDMLNDVERLRNGSDTQEQPKVIISLPKKGSWRKWTALAASICVLIGGSLIYRDYILPKDNISNTENGVEVTEEYDNISNQIIEGVFQEGTVEDEQMQGTVSGVDNALYEHKESVSTTYESFAQEICLECKAAIEKALQRFQVIDEGL